MKSVQFLVILSFFLILNSCDVIDCERGNGVTVRETLKPSGFDEIRLTITADVYLTQGDEFLVEVEGEENIIDLIDEDVRRDQWTIRFERCVRRHEKLAFYITLPELRAVSVSGSGEIVGETPFEVDNLDLSISGSGDIDLDVEGSAIDAGISGSGKIYLEGIVNNLNMAISGSGDLRAFNLETDNAEIRISGSGDAEVFVNNFLEVVISGSGDVYYKGSPGLDVRTSGSGQVIDAN